MGSSMPMMGKASSSARGRSLEGVRAPEGGTTEVARTDMSCVSGVGDMVDGGAKSASGGYVPSGLWQVAKEQ
jgi:hypothetical protein